MHLTFKMSAHRKILIFKKVKQNQNGISSAMATYRLTEKLWIQSYIYMYNDRYNRKFWKRVFTPLSQ